MSWSLEDFEKTSLDVGQWCWGTLQGAFNEKQTISQVITDAAIGMIPLVGDVTAARDLLSVSIHLSTDPRKREEIMEWVLLVILVFALIPVVGGVIKGVGRLALRVEGIVAKDHALLAEVIQFLNRMGHGDAPKWLKALNIAQYESQVLTKLKDFCATVQLAIRKSLEARVGKLLPEVWRSKIDQVSAGFAALQDMADRMVPKALREFEAKLKALQNMVYRGEIHEIATGGMPKVRREAEAYLEERRLAREIRRGRFPSSECRADSGEVEAMLTSKYKPKIEAGWPDILKDRGEIASYGKKPVFTKVATFSGEISAIGSEELAGKKLYRAFGNPSKHAPYPGGSKAGGRQPAFWGVGEVPKSAEEWRTRSAVLDEWNGNGFLAIVHLPADLPAHMDLKAWSGQIAEQYGEKVPTQYLEGGGQQLVVDLGELADEITAAGELLKQGKLPPTISKNGVTVELRATNWTNIEDVYGYSKFDENVRGAAQTRRLGTEEIQTKVTNSSATAVARAANSDNR